MLKTRRVLRAHTLPRLLHCLGDYGCIGGKKRGGAPCRIKIYRRKPDLRYVNGSGKVIIDRHLAPDQHQELTTSRGFITPCPCLPCLVDVCYRDRE